MEDDTNGGYVKPQNIYTTFKPGYTERGLNDGLSEEPMAPEPPPIIRIPSTVRPDDNVQCLPDKPKPPPKEPLPSIYRSDVQQTKLLTHIINRLKKHRFELLTFVFGFILALLIMIPLVVTRSDDNEPDSSTNSHTYTDPDYKINMKFDRLSAHHAIFVSNNDAVISNTFKTKTPNSARNSEQLDTYNGIMGNVCFGKGEKVYFQIEFFLSLAAFLPNSSSELFAEIGLVDPKKVDNHYSVGEGDGWSYNIHNCVSEICLSAKYYKQGIIDKIKTISLTNDIDMLETGKLGFFLNRKTGEFSVIDGDTMKIMYTFEQVTAHKKLCPVFGVYDPSSAEVELEILYAYNFTTVPVVNVIA